MSLRTSARSASASSASTSGATSMRRCTSWSRRWRRSRPRTRLRWQMADDSRRYTKGEFELILAKAGELGGSAGSVRRVTDGLTIDEIKSIASEAGLEPALVARAARLVSYEARPSLLQRIL